MAKIYTTIGVYLDGSFKVNGVSEENLDSHIEYNKKFRFGRGLIVDGEIINLGYFKENDLKRIIQEKKLLDIKISKDSAPYN